MFNDYYADMFAELMLRTEFKCTAILFNYKKTDLNGILRLLSYLSLFGYILSCLSAGCYTR